MIILARESDFDPGKSGPTEALQWPTRGIQRGKFHINFGHRCITEGLAATLLDDILPEAERPRQLLPLAKTLTDTVKMIVYRAETALVGLLRPHLANEAEAHSLIRELFVSGADLESDDQAVTLTIRIHRIASPVHDRAITLLLTDFTAVEFRHPETRHCFIYQLL